MWLLLPGPSCATIPATHPVPSATTTSPAGSLVIAILRDFFAVHVHLKALLECTLAVEIVLVITTRRLSREIVAHLLCSEGTLRRTGRRIECTRLLLLLLLLLVLRSGRFLRLALRI